MGPSQPLPLREGWEDVDTYIDALLAFTTGTPLFLNLCGGVHILDFLTSTPDLYTTLLPEEWRGFFHEHDLYDILDLILTDDLDQFKDTTGQDWNKEAGCQWKNGPLPPSSLLEYIHNVRRLSLKRDFQPTIPRGTSAIPRRVAVGMKSKKLHEVEYFSKYVDAFSTAVSEARREPITHIVDFGSGQNYLGRTLAHSYNRHIIAIERKHAFIQGAQGMDVHAQLTKKKKALSNPEMAYQNRSQKQKVTDEDLDQQSASAKTIEANDSEQICTQCSPNEGQPQPDEGQAEIDKAQPDEDGSAVFTAFKELNVGAEDFLPTNTHVPYQRPEDEEEEGSRPRGAIDYIEHNIQDGYLEPIIQHVVDPDITKNEGDNEKRLSDARVLVVSLHSCGNLLHHGIRSLVLNPSVAAIAMIGCCYNLLTERLGPATYKIPVLRHMHQRLVKTSTAYDPHGFPMSNHFEKYPHRSGGTGIKFNITARMMACQAPFNWSQEETEAFFTRHYYRALLQRFFVDRGIIPKPKIATSDSLKRASSAAASQPNNASANKLSAHADEDEDEDSWTKFPPVVIGALKKSAYQSFVTYAKAAMTKLARDPAHKDRMARLLNETPVEELEKYVSKYEHAKKNISIVWLLMAFSATLVEAMIVIDRWQFLREHMASGLVKECWVEPVFDYAESPRNLAVIAIKS